MDLFPFCGSARTCYTVWMDHWRKLGQKRKSIGWILIVALAFLTVLPAHVHFHHVDTYTGSEHVHEHLMDMHVFSSDLSSSHHDDAQVLMATPDGIIKVLDFKISPMLIFAILLTILSLALARFVPRQKSAVFIPIEQTYHFTPPLRGPPQ